MPNWPDITAKYGRIPLLRMGRSPKPDATGAGTRPNASRATLRKIWGYLARDKRRLALIGVLIVAGAALGIAGPFLLGNAVQTHLVLGQSEGLARELALLACIYAAQTGAVLLQNYLMIGVAQRAVAEMRRDLFAKLHRTTMSAYSGRKTGDLTSRLTNDIDNVSQTLSGTCLQIASSVITFAGMLGLMLWLDVYLTLISLALIPLMFWSMRWITRRTGRLFRAQQHELGGLAGFVDETVSGQLVVKSFAQEASRIDSFGGWNRKVAISSYWAQTYSGFIPKVFFVLNNLSFSVIAAAGSVLAIGQVVTIGKIVTFTEYARQFTRPLNDLASQINTMFAAVAGAERAFELLDAEEEKDSPSALRPDRLKGDIAFENVGFSYTEGKRTLDHLSFRVRPGQTVALVGPTGAGKSTVAQLIGRFYEATEGRIRIDGVDIRDYDRRALRSRMAFVLQDLFLFETTVRENIRYGRAAATDAEVEAAAVKANAHDFILKLPEGYDTVVGAEGTISQGQRQLLSIARAILADPVILVLDEATSSIDTVTELKVQEALGVLMKGRTNLVIAHRLGTVRQADLIVVLDGGRAIEQGTHSSLMERRGHYYRLHESSDMLLES